MKPWPWLYNSVDEMWRALLIELLDVHRPNVTEDSRAGEIVAEIQGWSGSLNTMAQMNLVANPVRKMSPDYCAAEVLWCMTGSNQTKWLLPYAPQYQERYGEEDGTAWGAYGYRLRDFWLQIGLVLENLVNTRQCVVHIHDNGDLRVAHAKRDIPCLVNFMFFLRDGKLHMTVTMRSNDAWLGFPCDVFAFTCLQRMLAATVNAEPGNYVHNVAGSLHLYARHLEGAKEAVQWNPRLVADNNGWLNDTNYEKMRWAASDFQLLTVSTPEEFWRDYVPNLAGLDYGDMGRDLVLACAHKLALAREPKPETAAAIPLPKAKRLWRS